MERRRDEGLVIRKGPWMAEEDEILMDYVNKYGPRDWSSIRSKGLLPRTGKSCRLRWVNKLKPDLKTGCKFSKEEEKVVIDLQAQFGNKWARIATYLPGRTDNDVKNFWSTRQKRLARILQTPTTPKAQKNNGKRPIFREIQEFEAPKHNLMSREGGSSESQSTNPSYTGPSDVIRMVHLPDLVNPNLPNLERNLPPFDLINPMDNKPCIVDPLQQFPCPQIPQPSSDLQFLPEEGQDLATGLVDTNLLGMFAHQDCLESDSPQFPIGLPFFGLDVKREDQNRATPDSFFDEFPADMFDLDPPPGSSEL